MKIQSIRIQNMHNVTDKTYSFDDINYIVGSNGAGKSTILEAIQLALLGYIPGYNKTNKAIISHANSNWMEVELQLDEFFIRRTYEKKNGSVKCNVQSDLEDPEDTLKIYLRDIELPVFNFSDFNNQSANMIKKWFIEFLPSDDAKIDIQNELVGSSKDIVGDCSALLSDVMSKYNSLSGKDADKLKALHQYLKDLKSFKKSEISRLQSTIESLIYYDDLDTSESFESISSKIKSLNSRKRILMSEKMTIDHNSIIKQQMLSLNIPTESLEENSEYIDNVQRRTELSAKFFELQKTYTSIQSEIVSKEAIIKSYNQIICMQGVCPYTKVQCDSAQTLVENASSEVDMLNQELNTLKSKLLDTSTQMDNLNSEVSQLSTLIDTAINNYNRYSILKSQLTPESKDIDTINESIASIDAEIEDLTNISIKIKANDNFNVLNDKVKKDKYQIELDMLFIDEWIKKTSPNGLQNQIVSNPLNKLQAELDKYLQLFFKENVSAGFNLSTEANSFSFGIKRNDSYIPYDNLSSGEKCLYLLAFLSCIVINSGCIIKTLMIDDMLDHLDDANMMHLFNSIEKATDIQYIFAGIKPLLNSGAVHMIEVTNS